MLLCVIAAALGLKQELAGLAALLDRRRDRDGVAQEDPDVCAKREQVLIRARLGRLDLGNLGGRTLAQLLEQPLLVRGVGRITRDRQRARARDEVRAQVRQALCGVLGDGRVLLLGGFEVGLALAPLSRGRRGEGERARAPAS